jgi:hypothetical protein
MHENKFEIVGSQFNLIGSEMECHSRVDRKRRRADLKVWEIISRPRKVGNEN